VLGGRNLQIKGTKYGTKDGKENKASDAEKTWEKALLEIDPG
jgi:hypothetical protein